MALVMQMPAWCNYYAHARIPLRLATNARTGAKLILTVEITSVAIVELVTWQSYAGAAPSVKTPPQPHRAPLQPHRFPRQPHRPQARVRLGVPMISLGARTRAGIVPLETWLACAVDVHSATRQLLQHPLQLHSPLPLQRPPQLRSPQARVRLGVPMISLGATTRASIVPLETWRTCAVDVHSAAHLPRRHHHRQHLGDCVPREYHLKVTPIPFGGSFGFIPHATGLTRVKVLRSAKVIGLPSPWT